jgi:ketosteroid isomerase-like protein
MTVLDRARTFISRRGRQEPVDEKAVAQGFFERLEVGDVEGAMALTTPDGEFQAVALGVKGTIGGEGQELLEELRRALPDVTLQVTRLFAGHDGTAVAEVFVDGTQADDLFGIVNQEKHVDVKTVWLLHVTDGRIDGIRAYWCQNQLYRRLGVKRLDRVTITA